MDPTPTTATITQLIQQQRRGALHAELTDTVAQVVAAVMTHGKAGSVTIKLTIKPEGDEAVSIADSYSAKVPTPPAKASIFFADDTGKLSRARLNQPELPLQGLDSVHVPEPAGGSEAVTS
jgi:hypothetical protein